MATNRDLRKANSSIDYAEMVSTKQFVWVEADRTR